MKVKPIDRVGKSRQGCITATYDEIVKAVGFEPNATHLDDPVKVKASWGFEAEDGRQAFIWCYKWHGDPKDCERWSIDDSDGLLYDLGL